eukprot:m.126556 g.126556  ORF g.126556 m.126556 type:complete len:607 (+) comp16341_c0_seq1:216-2036(+)
MADEVVHMCVECEDQEAALLCVTCDEPFCGPCWAQQHNSGSRKEHETKALLGAVMPQPLPPSGTPQIDVAPSHLADEMQVKECAEEQKNGNSNGSHNPQTPGDAVAAAAAAAADTALSAEDRAQSSSSDASTADAVGNSASSLTSHLTKSGVYRESVRYIPMRLSSEERSRFLVLEGALNVSEYTDKVDTFGYGRQDRIKGQLEDFMNILVGLLTCNRHSDGKRICERETLSESKTDFQKLFEIGRRYKIMNPDKMRSTYGKLMCILQDAIDQREFLGFNPRIGIVTVEVFLQNRNGLALLQHPLLDEATMPIEVEDGESSASLQEKRESKQKAIETLCKKFASAELTEEDVGNVLKSISDSHSYQTSASLPVTRMIQLLKENFSPSSEDNVLAISYGMGGSMLSHSHAKQYQYVLQSLLLWESITQQMFGLWHTADADILSDRCEYRLSNTGQGLHRVQACPGVSNLMHGIVSRAQRECGSWVGLSVVHVGDRDVPNALVFIDKYTQVPRILTPIVHVVDKLDALEASPATAAIIAAYGGAAKIRRVILTDFFRHGFDGSGDDGGSCIDGRLTSAWNWCSKLEKKPYYHIFLLAGFEGFDGSFKA